MNSNICVLFLWNELKQNDFEERKKYTRDHFRVFSSTDCRFLMCKVDMILQIR